MEESQETDQQKLEAETLRRIKQMERQQVADDAEQVKEAIELRIAEAEFLLLQDCPINLIIYRNGDEVGVIDSVNQELCREVLERILKEDKEKLSNL